MSKHILKEKKTSKEDFPHFRHYKKSGHPALILSEEPEEKYKLAIDSASIVGIYGLHNDKLEHEFSFAALDTYSTFTVNIQNPKASYIVELLDNKGDITRRGRIKEGKVDFFFLILVVF